MKTIWKPHGNLVKTLWTQPRLSPPLSHSVEFWWLPGRTWVSCPPSTCTQVVFTCQDGFDGFESGSPWPTGWPCDLSFCLISNIFSSFLYFKPSLFSIKHTSLFHPSNPQNRASSKSPSPQLWCICPRRTSVWRLQMAEGQAISILSRRSGASHLLYLGKKLQEKTQETTIFQGKIRVFLEFLSMTVSLKRGL